MGGSAGTKQKSAPLSGSMTFCLTRYFSESSVTKLRFFVACPSA
jgi:hypothetical protein